MKRFCQECGKEAQAGHNSCIHCGTPLQVQRVDQTEQRIAHKKQPMPKKQKLILSVIVGIVILIAGFSVWANAYQSAESVQKRFETAVSKDDHVKIKKMLIHEDGSEISKPEAQAFLKLVKEEGNKIVFDLTSVVKDGKFLGIYEAHKVKAVDQFALYDDLVDGLTFAFNDKEFPEHEREGESVVYGPLVPGIYTVKAVFKGEYGETTMEDDLILNSYDRQHTWLGMEVPVSKVTFYVANYDQFDPSQAYVQLNDEKIPISKEGETDEIGPFILDGSQKVQVVVDMPWGEVVSESFEVDDTHLYINAALISKDQYEEVLPVLTDFGEQYVTALAEKNTKGMKGISQEIKEEIAATFYADTYYSGKLDMVEINKDSIHIDTDSKAPVFTILVRYITQEGYHDLTESPELYEEHYTWRMELSFNTDEKEWLVTSLDGSNMWGDFEATDTQEGSKKLRGPSKEVIADAENLEAEIAIAAFINSYTQASVDAINYRDFDVVEKYITEDGPRRKEAREYIDYLDSKDIYEEWYGSELEKVEKIDENTWKITVIEEFDIQRPDSSDVKKFRTTLILKHIDNQYYVDELTATNEI